MAAPNKKLSRSRTRARRANWRLTSPKLQACPHCHAPRLAHTVCPNCGQYKGREVKTEEQAAGE